MPRRRRTSTRPASATSPDAPVERLRQLVSHLPAIIWATDTELRFTSSLGAGLSALGLAPDQVVGMSLTEYFGTTDPTHSGVAAHRAALAGTKTSYEQVHDDHVYLTTVEPLRDLAGQVVGTFGCAFEVTELRRAETTLRQREALLEGIIQSTPECIKVVDVDCRLLQMNSAGLAMIEADRLDDVRGLVLSSIVDPDDRNAFKAFTRHCFAGGSGTMEFGIIGLKGGRRRLETTAVPLRDGAGAIHAVLGISRDVTERNHLEEQLRQSPKLEALGLLAGGIAHDFNNLITVITGHANFVYEGLAPGDGGREDLLAVRQAADRATALTRQLLAFSRKQVLRLTVLSVNDTVRGAQNLLGRLIGDDVHVDVQLAPDLWSVKADAGQLEQVIINLAVNARDAMPTGGTLTIETRNVPGDSRNKPDRTDSVLLSVHDTGVGFNAETRRHLFEPFFTTKGAGLGTGLGLATVHGIVKQLGGTITAQCVSGHGSEFQVVLPRAAGVPSTDQGMNFAPETDLRGGSETVLLVEDNDAVRALLLRTLTSLGYGVVEASGPTEALAHREVLRGRVDILVTDVVMLGMNGRELAAQLTVRYPDLPVLYMSGYTDDAVMRRGVLDAEVEFLQKPFTPQQLARRIRTILDVAPGVS